MREYDLILGILACQLRLVSRGSLIRSVALADKSEDPLSEILLANHALSVADYELLIRLVDNIIHAHRGDEKAALETFGGQEAVESAFIHSVHFEEGTWQPQADKTILAEHLPHGLPPQIMPESLGRYTGGSEYARGGIGRVLLVHDEQMGRDIILKELLPQHTTSPTAETLSRPHSPGSPGSPIRQSAAMMARFLQEAQVTGRLEHPSIVPVYELGIRTDGQLYYTMKLVRGHTLSVAIKECTGLDTRLALLRFYLDICQAMAYAHSKSIIHRDLKPSNIMIGEFGECVVLDWGLAKVLEEQDAHQDDLNKTIDQLKMDGQDPQAHHTRSKEVLGTPLYMSPEQARAENDLVGPRSDVYSLGVILYEILSGEVPHLWTNTLDTVQRVGTLPAPPLHSAAPDVPPELAAICDKALQHDPTHRYPSARELADDINQFLDGAVVEAYSYKARDLLKRVYRQHKTLIHTISLAAMVIITMGIISYVNIVRANQKTEQARVVAVEQRAIAETQRDAAEAQRTRAETAEERTAREKYVSDIRLADAYVRDYQFQAAEDTLLATHPAYRHIEWGYLMAQCHQDLATLRGHTNVVFETFFSPDGKSIVTVAGDQSARLWDSETLAVLQEWTYSDALLRHVAFNPGGSQLALCLTDGSVRMVDPGTGEALFMLKGHTAPVNFCAFNAAGDRLLTASSDRTAKLWDLAGREVVLTLNEHPDELKAVGFCDGEQKLYTVTSDEHIRLFEGNGTQLSVAPGMAVKPSKTGTFLVARQGNHAFLYQASDLSEVLRLPHEAAVRWATYHADRNVVVTACADGNARLWNAENGTLEKIFNVREDLRQCQIAPDGRLLITMAVNGLIVVWDLDNSNEIARFSGHRGATATMDFDPHGQRLLTCSMDGTARLWKTTGSPLIGTLATLTDRVTGLSIARDGATRLAATSQDGQVIVQDFRSGQRIYTGAFSEKLGGTKAAIAPQGDRLVLVTDQFHPLVLQLPEGQVLHRLKGHDGYIQRVNYSSDGTTIATNSWDSTTRLWDATTGASQGVLAGHTDIVYHAAFSSDGTHVATASNDKTAIVWNRADQTKVFSIQHTGRVVHVAFSHDADLVATASADDTIQVWRVSTRNKVFDLSGQTSDITSVSFSADDKRLLSVSRDHTVRIWELATGSALLDVDTGSEAATDADFGSENNTLLITMESGAIKRLFGFPIDTPPPLRTPDGLQEHLIAYKATRAANLSSQPVPDSGGAINHILSAPGTIERLTALSALTTATPADQAPTLTEDIAARFRPVPLQAGDVLLSLNGNAPEAFSAYVTALTRTPPDQNGTPFYLEVLRNSVPTRFNITMLPVTENTRTITMPRAQATALLEQAIKTLQSNSEAILQVNKRWAQYARHPMEKPDSLAGLLVNVPGNLFGRKLLDAAGIQPLDRILTVHDTPVTSLSQLITLCENGLRHLEANETFTLTLHIQRGEYEARTVTITHQP